MPKYTCAACGFQADKPFYEKEKDKCPNCGKHDLKPDAGQDKDTDCAPADKPKPR